MKHEIKLTDEVVLPVMAEHNITREEAEKRLQLLFKSSILTDGNPDDEHTQYLISEFLAQDSETLETKVAFDICINECYNNKEFINAYDKLNINKTDMRGVLDGTETDPKRIKKEITRFAKFVKDTVFDRLLQTEQP